MTKKINLKKSATVNPATVETPATETVKPADVVPAPAPETAPDIETVVIKSDDVVISGPAMPQYETPANAPQPDTDATDDDGDGDDDGETETTDGKARKERAKINPDALPIADILKKHLESLVNAVKLELGDKENADELAHAKVYGAGLNIISDISNVIEGRFIAYAPRSYKGKNPSNHWLIWENTRKAIAGAQAETESKLAKLYNVTDENVYKLLETGFYTKTDAQKTISEFFPNLIITNNVLLDEKIKEIENAGVKTVLVRISAYENATAYIKPFMSAGYMLAGFENVPEREYNGISKKFYAENNLYKFVKA